MTDRAFRGIWIPAEIWLDKGLSLQEKIMLVEIDSLQDPVRGCYKSNGKFAEFFQLSRNRVSEIISALAEKKLIRVELVKEGKRVIERRIFMTARLSNGGRKIEQGCSENRDTPVRDSDKGCSENREERGTVKSNSVKGINNIDFSSWPAEPSAQVFADYKKTRKAALTQTAVNRMAKELHLAAEAGYSVDDCLSECCERGWRGFKFEWLARSRGQHLNQSGARPQQRHTQITGDNVGAGMTENEDGTLNF